jgi:hypothetical protein
MIEARCGFFPSDSARVPTPSPPVIVTNAAGPSEMHIKPYNLETIDTEDKAGSEIGKGKRKEVFPTARNHRQRTCPPSRTRPFFSSP